MYIKLSNCRIQERDIKYLQNVDQYWSDEFINIAGGLHKLVIKES